MIAESKQCEFSSQTSQKYFSSLQQPFSRIYLYFRGEPFSVMSFNDIFHHLHLSCSPGPYSNKVERVQCRAARFVKSSYARL